MTYREGMEALRPSRMTSDAGWGCMLRSGQMLLCNALVNRTLGTEWRLAVRLGAEEQSHTATRTAGVLDACPDPVALRRVLSLFADCPDAPFGIHAVSEHALAHRGMHPGDWYTPGAISTTLAEMLCAAMPFGVRGYCADGATVARDRVAEELGAQGCTGLLVFVPLRLSPARIDPSYEGQIAELFHYPQFVGIVGGRPRSSLYFFASQDTCLYYLNPHYVHDADTLECPDSLDSLDVCFLPFLFFYIYIYKNLFIDTFYKSSQKNANPRHGPLNVPRIHLLGHGRL